MIPFTVIGGYLGAGKTTLLNRLLTGNTTTRFALIINDFGEINIDAGLIESQTDTQINLTNGCVCCSLSDGFSDALEQLLALEPTPEHIVVEASGVADIANLSQYGRGPGLRLDGVLVLVDAESLLVKATDKYVGLTFRRQLGAADLIVLNKTDLVSRPELAVRRRWLQDEYPEVKVVDSIRANLPLEILFGTHEHAPFAAPISRVAPEEHAHYATWSYQTEQVIPASSLQAFTAQLPAWVLRAKGQCQTGADNWHQLQVVGARAEIDPVNHTGLLRGARLVAIGLSHDFDVAVLDQLARDFL